MPEKGGLSAFHPSTYLGGILAMGIGGFGCEDGMDGGDGWRQDNTVLRRPAFRLRLRPIATCS